MVGLVCKIGLVILSELPWNKEIDAKLTQTWILCQQRPLTSNYSELMIHNETSVFIWNQYSWKYFCVKWATLSDGDPDTGQTATQRSRRGQARLDWPYQLSHSGLLRTIETSRLNWTYFSMGSFYFKMLAKRGRDGEDFNFLSMSEFPLTKRCLPSRLPPPGSRG